MSPGLSFDIGIVRGLGDGFQGQRQHPGLEFSGSTFCLDPAPGLQTHHETISRLRKLLEYKDLRVVRVSSYESSWPATTQDDHCQETTQTKRQPGDQQKTCKSPPPHHKTTNS